MPRANSGTYVKTHVLEAANRNKITEDLLEEIGIKFTLVQGMSTNSIDLEESQRNQARINALDEATVRKYERAVERGAKFPPIVLYKTSKAKNAKYKIGDGNHRTAAHHRHNAPLDAYVMDEGTPKKLITDFVFRANNVHGLSMSPEERVKHALFFVNSQIPMKNAAAMMDVPLRDLQAAKRLQDIDERAIAAGLNMTKWEALRITVRGHLIAIKTDEVLKPAVELAVDARMSSTQVKELVEQLNGTKSANAQQKIVKDMRRALEDQIADASGKGSRVNHTPKSRIAMMFGQFRGITWGNIAQYYGAEDRADVIDDLRDMSRVAAEAADKLAAEG